MLKPDEDTNAAVVQNPGVPKTRKPPPGMGAFTALAGTLFKVPKAEIAAAVKKDLKKRRRRRAQRNAERNTP